VYDDPTAAGGADLSFEEVDQGGAVKLAPKPFNTAATASNEYQAYDLAWGGDHFGAAWATSSQIYLLTLTSDGNLPIAGPTHFPLNSAPGFLSDVGDVAVARVPGANWAILYDLNDGSLATSPRYIGGNTVSATGVAGVVSRLTTFTPLSSSLAATSASFVTAVSDQANGAAPTSNVALRTVALGSPQSLTVSGRAPVVGSGPNGFAVATGGATDVDLPRLAIFSSAGVSQCAPVPFADKDFQPSSVVATPKGYLVASGPRFVAQDSALRVQEVFSDCTLGQLFTIEPGPVSRTKIVGSATGYAVVWFDKTAAVSKLRLLGPNYCN
jgi:hypothetical protein